MSIAPAAGVPVPDLRYGFGDALSNASTASRARPCACGRAASTRTPSPFTKLKYYTCAP
jgi:hypothetical protein